MVTGMRYTATVQGSVWKPVSCEFCRTDWAYKMVRKVTGQGRSVLFLDNEGAKQRARDEAYANLSKSLENEFDAVSCPKCGNYQSGMLSKVRWDKKGGVTILGIVALVASAVVLYFGGLIAAGATAGVATIVLVLGEVRRRRFDPNADAADRANQKRENVVRRSDYEAAIEAATQSGVDPGQLARIEWRRAA